MHTPHTHPPHTYMHTRMHAHTHVAGVGESLANKILKDFETMLFLVYFLNL